jgi:2'-5' RNA ligase
MRLFIGFSLPSQAVEALLRVQQQFAPSASELRWSEPEGWHVTLQFLGQVNEERAACVPEQLRTVKAARVPVRIEGLGFFERAGVFWAGITLTPELLALQQFVTGSMRNCGFVPEARAYNPHITLARARGRAGPKALAPLRQAIDKSRINLRAEFVSTEFLLYESFPGPEGSRYEIRERFALH